MGAISFSIDAQLVAFLVRELPLKLFVETGTFKGDSLEVARPLFERCLSVEASPELFEQARQRFQAHPAVELHLGESPAFLRSQRALFEQTPTLFWLDAHWCMADNTSGATSQSPLLEELSALGALHPQSVVLVDDARLYLCAPPAPHRFKSWPDFHSVLSGLLQLSGQHRLSIVNDVMICAPLSLQSALGSFAHQQGIDWLNVLLEYRAFRADQAAQRARRQRRRLGSVWRRLCQVFKAES